MFTRRIKTALGTITAVGLLGLFAVPSEVRAAITVTVTDSSGAAVGGAFVAVLNSDGDALDSAITAKDGTVSVNEAGGAGLVVAAPGLQTKTAAGATAQTVALTASTKSKLSYANAFGAQVRTIAADGESGVYYATSDAQPTVWRTSDYAGSWSPVPTTADSEAASATAIRITPICTTMPPFARPTNPRKPCRRVARTSCRSAAPPANPPSVKVNSGASPVAPTPTLNASAAMPPHAGQNKRVDNSSPDALRHGSTGAMHMRNNNVNPTGTANLSKKGSPTTN